MQITVLTRTAARITTRKVQRWRGSGHWGCLRRVEAGLRKVVRFIALSVVVFMAASTALLYFGQRFLFYPAPQERLVAPPAGFQFIETTTSDGLTLRAAFRSPATGKPTLLFFHGNGDSIAGADMATRMLTEAGYGALLVEYRGYGGNRGVPSEQGLYRDGEAAIAWLNAQGISPKDTVFVGNSIGSGPATEMALRHNPAGLVLVSGFASLPFVVSDLYPFIPATLLVRDHYSNETKVGWIRTPILLLHGDADPLVRPANSHRMKKAAQNASLIIVPGKGHELAYLPEGQQLMLEWLATLP
jgi:uncharacterized protein